MTSEKFEAWVKSDLLKAERKGDTIILYIAIHPRKGSFSDKWIEYCDKNHVSYKLVNCYESNIVDRLRDYEGLLWSWNYYVHQDVLFARQLTAALETVGKRVFPDSRTCWHFDDKLGQKYLLEAIGAPLVPSYVFFDRKQAVDWAQHAVYPKVFKLRGGAGSENVRLVHSRQQALRLIRKAFGGGFKAKSRLYFLKERLWHFERDRDLRQFLNILKGVARLIIPTTAEKKLSPQKNYVYFQDFIPGNDHDIRIIIIGKRAFGIKRMVRKNDFRASGSGFLVYDKEQLPLVCVKLAFDLSRKLSFQCMAYDFIFKNSEPLLVEISYCFTQKGYLPCPGYWIEKTEGTLEWIEGYFTPEYFMIEDFIEACKKNKNKGISV